MLEEIGHDYHLVHDGRLALQAAKEYKPDAILLDIGLPGMDGYEVCRMFRKDEEGPCLPRRFVKLTRMSLAHDAGYLSALADRQCPLAESEAVHRTMVRQDLANFRTTEVVCNICAHREFEICDLSWETPHEHQ
jgi:CheY-like chemotaxis protein